MKKVIIFALVSCLIMGCSSSYVNEPLPYKIREPKEKSLIDENIEGYYQIDYRNDDVSKFVFNNEEEIRYALFTTHTIWSKETEEKYSPSALLEENKDPKRGIRTLHERGIDGSGINVAIIDDEPLLEHEEYKDTIKWYKTINVDERYYAGMHSTAVISILAGQNVGVAPGVNVYYVAREYADIKENVNAIAINHIVDYHLQASQEDKISLISISTSWGDETHNVEALREAVDRAEEEGITVISVTMSLDASYPFNGVDIGKDIIPCGTWRRTTLHDGVEEPEQLLLIPMDGRTTASPESTRSYTYYGDAGRSWAVPYISGVYALALQVNPTLRFDEFWEIALKTGEPLSYQEQTDIGRLITPVEIIKYLESN